MGSMFYRFDVRRPLTLKEASEILHELGEGALPLAGGTDLMILVRERKVRPKVLVDLWELRPKLSYVERGGGIVRIGALTTVKEICSAPELRDVRYAGFAGLCHWFATPYIRSLATIGGNLGTGHSFSDFIPLTLVLDAEVVLHGVNGERIVPVRGLYRDKRVLNKSHDEVIKEVIIREPPERSATVFMKFDRRSEHVYGYVTTAVYLQLAENDEILDVRIAFDRVTRRHPERAYQTENYLRGKEFSIDLITYAAREILPKEMRRKSDFRASAEYRLDLSKTIMRRALYLAWAKIVGKPIDIRRFPITEFLRIPPHKRA